MDRIDSNENFMYFFEFYVLFLKDFAIAVNKSPFIKDTMKTSIIGHLCKSFEIANFYNM